MRRTVVLLILDGWGLGSKNESNPIYVAKPETFAWLEANYPMTSLQASGISAGLPWGEVGSSEVGHLIMGAGKIVYQYYPKISMAVRDQTFFENKVLKDVFTHAKKFNSAVNLVGLLTKANTHASLEHLDALLKMAEREGVANVKLHLFADGKDSPPRTLEELLRKVPVDKLASLTGRYYAMDRKENWTLTQKAYECLIGTGGLAVTDLGAEIQEVYAKGLIEEFFPPIRLGEGREIKDNEAVLFFNFREDSIRQIAEPFVAADFEMFPVKRFTNLLVASMTPYSEKFKIPVAFLPDKAERPLAQVLADAGKTQLRLAESYKRAHVTYFFNGYREEPFPNEYRVILPSMSVPHPDDHPEMMAKALTDRLLEAVQNQSFDFVLINYANPDTMGHTGNYQACLEVVKIMDREVGRLLKVVSGTPTVLLITADHGNLEEVFDPATIHMETQHDPSPVPFYLVAEEFKKKKFLNWQDPLNETGGLLSDIAPTVLELMGLPVPKEMTGHSLLRQLIT